MNYKVRTVIIAMNKMNQTGWAIAKQKNKISKNRQNYTIYTQNILVLCYYTNASWLIITDHQILEMSEQKIMEKIGEKWMSLRIENQSIGDSIVLSSVVQSYCIILNIPHGTSGKKIHSNFL